jgi:hypothetical protein
MLVSCVCVLAMMAHAHHMPAYHVHVAPMCVKAALLQRLAVHCSRLPPGVTGLCAVLHNCTATTVVLWRLCAAACVHVKEEGLGLLQHRRRHMVLYCSVVADVVYQLVGHAHHLQGLVVHCSGVLRSAARFGCEVSQRGASAW